MIHTDKLTAEGEALSLAQKFVTGLLVVVIAEL
jgi:hypothetical protein